MYKPQTKKSTYIVGKAKPCIENGVKFDSELERQYSRFFTLLGWQWEREPFEFPTWRPDFIVTLPNGQRFLIEIKPAYSFFDLSKCELALKRGYTVALCPNNPLSSLTFAWKGSVNCLRDAMPENAVELWEEAGL